MDMDRRHECGVYLHREGYFFCLEGVITSVLHYESLESRHKEDAFPINPS